MHVYKTWTDQQLITALNTGDRQAFEFIYHTYVGELYKFARRSISNHEEAQEILQDLFLSLWARHQSLKIDNLRIYLFQATRFSIFQYIKVSKLRQKYREHYLLFEAVRDTISDQPVRSIDPETLRSVIESIAELPERCQAAFRLRWIDNLSNTEISQRMDIRKTTVERYMVTAFTHLRTRFRHIIEAS